jgi:hypothetical protein
VAVNIWRRGCNNEDLSTETMRESPAWGADYDDPHAPRNVLWTYLCDPEVILPLSLSHLSLSLVYHHSQTLCCERM